MVTVAGLLLACVGFVLFDLLVYGDFVAAYCLHLFSLFALVAAFANSGWAVLGLLVLLGLLVFGF